MKTTLISFVSILLLSLAANAAIVVDEEFTHADGNLVGQTPTPGPGGTWAAHSGAGNKAIQVASGEISLDQSSGSGEDVNTGFTAIGSGDTIYAGFDVRLPSGQTVDVDADGLYFAHFKDSGFVFRGRVFVTETVTGDFRIGLDADDSTVAVTWATDLSFDTTYRVIVSYDFDTGNCELWIDATMAGDTSIVHTVGTASTAIEAFSFRQSNDYTGSQVIDDLIVSDTFPEAVPVELMSFSVE
ncbi:MAG: hypothetical protein V3T72_17335 [Thermoanaerobaculia bacterium]